MQQDVPVVRLKDALEDCKPIRITFTFVDVFALPQSTPMLSCFLPCFALQNFLTENMTFIRPRAWWRSCLPRIWASVLATWSPSAATCWLRLSGRVLICLDHILWGDWELIERWMVHARFGCGIFMNLNGSCSDLREAGCASRMVHSPDVWMGHCHPGHCMFVHVVD